MKSKGSVKDDQWLSPRGSSKGSQVEVDHSASSADKGRHAESSRPLALENGRAQESWEGSEERRRRGWKERKDADVGDGHDRPADSSEPSSAHRELEQGRRQQWS